MTNATEPVDWGDSYDAKRELYEALESEGEYALRQAIAETGIKVHTVGGRVKDRRSFLEKIERKQYADPFADMPDVVGLRVVCLFLADLPKIRTIVHDQFEVLEEENKVEGAQADTFGYMSHHFVCTLKSGHSGPRYDKIKKLRREPPSPTSKSNSFGTRRSTPLAAQPPMGDTQMSVWRG